MQVNIIGGGVIGLCSAYYLRKQGFDVTVIEKNNMTNGCSYGNMGYVSPSHFIPIATPGIISQGLRWMLNSSSPFFIKPRLNRDLIRWGLLFRNSATAKKVEANAPHLNNLLQLSRELMNDLKNDLPSFRMVEKGCWMLYKKPKTAEHEKHLAGQAEAFGLKTIFCNKAEVQEREPEIEVDVEGGVLYLDDCHLDPAAFMRSLYSHLQKVGVKFWLNTEVLSFRRENNRVIAAETSHGELTASSWLIANGSWMGLMAKKLCTTIPMQPGKGYSVVYEHNQKNLHYPSILVDHRTATSPIDRWLRIGGTMELSGHNDQVMPKRVMAIYNAFKLYYPKMELPVPDLSRAWYGYRPVSPDGMPYIGKDKQLDNVFYAGGHAMLGVSAAAGTGQIMSDLISGKKPGIDLSAFEPQRFS